MFFCYLIWWQRTVTAECFVATFPGSLLSSVRNWYMCHLKRMGKEMQKGAVANWNEFSATEQRDARRAVAEEAVVDILEFAVRHVGRRELGLVLRIQPWRSIRVCGALHLGLSLPRLSVLFRVSLRWCFRRERFGFLPRLRSRTAARRRPRESRSRWLVGRAALTCRSPPAIRGSHPSRSSGGGSSSVVGSPPSPGVRGREKGQVDSAAVEARQLPPQSSSPSSGRASKSLNGGRTPLCVCRVVQRGGGGSAEQNLDDPATRVNSR
jgi:hypothetical protein